MKTIFLHYFSIRDEGKERTCRLAQEGGKTYCDGLVMGAHNARVSSGSACILDCRAKALRLTRDSSTDFFCFYGYETASNVQKIHVKFIRARDVSIRLFHTFGRSLM